MILVDAFSPEELCNCALPLRSFNDNVDLFLCRILPVGPSMDVLDRTYC